MTGHPDVTEQPDPTTGPYGSAAMTYWRSGWAPLPLPPRAKKHPPEGYTGNTGAWPSGADVHAWTEDHPGGNIALRLPPGVIGLDVDAYGQKAGGLVLAQLQEQLGELPPTWRSTSRDDGVSGIRLYTIPESLRWPGILGPGIEVLRHGHRYAVAWPSIHPDTGGTYRWITPETTTALHDIPTPDDLPALPEEWVQHFTGGEVATTEARADLNDRGATDWLTGRTTGTPCRHMTKALRDSLPGLTAATSRHDHTLALTNRLIWLAGQGHTGIDTALTQASAAFTAAVGTDRDEREATSEWDRMIVGAVRIAAAAHPATPPPDPCDDPFAGLIDRSAPSAATPAPTGTTSATITASQPGSTSTPSTSPTPGSTASASISADADTSGPATGAATTPTVTTSPALGGPASLGDLPEGHQADVEHFYYQELARLQARGLAQKWLETRTPDDVIADRVRRRILDDKAATAYRLATEPPADAIDYATLAEVLARPADPPARIGGLIPWEGSALIVAQRKTGKTTFMLNYARCLLTGEDFLSEFPVIPLDPTARVAFLNYEVSAAQIGRWANDVGVDVDRLILVNVRGRRNPLNHPEDRAQLAAALREQNVQSIIVDPFGRAYSGQSQNDNGEVQAFLVDLDLFVRAEVKATDLMLATHAGWDGERSRGASALEDWGDTIITLTKDAEEEDRRYMRAIGRDVDIDEDELSMDPLTRTLTRTGNGSRRAQKGDRSIAELSVFAVRVARENPGCSQRQMVPLIKEMYDAPPLRKDGRLGKAIKFAEQQGQMRVEKGGAGRPDSHFVAQLSTSDPSDPTPTPGVTHRTDPTAPLRVGSVGDASETTQKGGDGHLIERSLDDEALRFDTNTGEVVEP